MSKADPRIPGGAERRDPVKAEFWKPETPKDVLVGVVTEFAENALGRHMIVSPAIVWPTGAKEPQGFASLAVGLNADLRKRVSDDLIDQPIAIIYTGKTPTPKGAMRCFELATVPMDEWRAYADKCAPGLREATGEAPTAVDEDDLPF